VRVRVVEQTQKEPFNRATVQLLPDDEITASYYESATRLMASSPSSRDDVVSEDVVSHDVASDDVASDDVASDHVAPLPSSRQRHDRSSWVHTLAHAAAVVSELDWQEFENANIPLTVQGGVTVTADVAALSPLSTQEGLEEQLSVDIPIRQQDAMREALRLVHILQLAPQNLSQVLGVPVLSTTDLTANGILSHSASMPAWDGWLERGGGETQTETATEEMEAKLWVEIDQLLRHFNRLRHGVSIPWQLLGLLPYKPPEPWPLHFRLEKAARSMAALQLPPRPPPVTECAGQMVSTGRQTAFMRVGDKYDPLRRAQKVSYLATFLLGVDQGIPGQAMLEARSTRHRLAMLLKLLVELNCDLAKKTA
jgi:hypothetical protein